MSSSTLVHTHLRAAVCSCGFKLGPFSAYFEEVDDGGRETKRGRLVINSELPEDILLEILLRLPVKSLSRFKCVCKFWYDLIRSPKFMALHDTNNFQKKRVSLYCHSYNYDYPATITLKLFDAPIHLTIPVCVEFVRLVGCSNGLVCLCLTRRHNTFALWNPATTERRLIYETESTRPRNSELFSGFCFDSFANTYKIVRVAFYPFKESLFWVEVPEGTVYVILYVFTLNDDGGGDNDYADDEDSWRRKILFAPSRFPNGGFMSEATYIGRCMYWTVSAGNSVPDEYILCLDMVHEEFTIIEVPCGDHSHCVTELLDYKGSLAMFIWNESDCSPGRRFDMWVWNGCGDTEHSWCKQLTFTPSVAHVERALGFFSKGDDDFVVLSTPDQCFLWDINSGETTGVIFKNDCIYPFFLYSESFASVY